MIQIIKTTTLKAIEKRVAEMQNYIDVTLSTYSDQITKTYTGNPYPTYDAAITELARKYEGVAEWGILMTKNIIDLRAAFIIAGGIKVQAKNGQEDLAERELSFLQEFFRENKLDFGMTQEFAKEGELEGRFLAKLIPDSERKNINLRFIPYTSAKYQVKSNPDDYSEYLKVEIPASGTAVAITLEEDEFVYAKFSGRVNKVNELMPKVASILRQIEDVDKALYDLRKMNRLFASPTPYFETQDRLAAQSMHDRLKEIRWNVGKFLVGPAKFSMVSMDAAGATSISSEIMMNMKIVSGATGVPVNFLGLPELMSNRSTSGDMFEFIGSSTNKERITWLGVYNEIIRKAILMANDKFNLGLDPEIVEIVLPPVSSEKTQELTTVWLPLYEAGVLSLKAMLSKIPDIDVESEFKSAQDATLEKLEQLKLTTAEPQAKTGYDPTNGGQRTGQADPKSNPKAGAME
jgi:hypothetical protein